jgi:hypothetical protein
MNTARTIDEVCGRPEGSFKKFVKLKESYLRAMNKLCRARIRYRNKPVRRFFAVLFWNLMLKSLRLRLWRRFFLFIFKCARGGNRTHTTLRSADFKSTSATNYDTRAGRPRWESNPRIEILQISELPLFYVAYIPIGHIL